MNQHHIITRQAVFAAALRRIADAHPSMPLTDAVDAIIRTLNLALHTVGKADELISTQAMNIYAEVQESDLLPPWD